MTLEDIVFVIKRDGLYLDTNDKYGLHEAAWKYQSSRVFSDAEECSGEVFMLLPNGREIKVSEEDFIKP